MIILQSQISLSKKERDAIHENLYHEGVNGLMLLPDWINLLAITNDDCSKIEILPPKDDDL